MVPDLAIDYPDGMGGVGLDEGDLRRYLGRKLVVLLGDADTDPNAPDLPRNDAAMAQGPHRYARGLWHFEHCRKVAERVGVEFGWRLETLPGVSHLDQVVYDHSGTILASAQG